MNYEHEDDPKEESKEEEICGNCKFRRGERCHRFPPQFTDENSRWRRPMVIFSSWCGEWKPNE